MCSILCPVTSLAEFLCEQFAYIFSSSSHLIRVPSRRPKRSNLILSPLRIYWSAARVVIQLTCAFIKPFISVVDNGGSDLLPHLLKKILLTLYGKPEGFLLCQPLNQFVSLPQSCLEFLHVLLGVFNSNNFIEQASPSLSNRNFFLLTTLNTSFQHAFFV